MNLARQGGVELGQRHGGAGPGHAGWRRIQLGKAALNSARQEGAELGQAGGTELGQTRRHRTLPSRRASNSARQGGVEFS
ncbi:hypothetical protein OG203_01825 [Nocardia sp. NBC_01499]|uniref:hypothetical protein n=1 Tax=Nocardia sp. NBC_01499 TaxID=2903597 RepID=UPI00386A6941